MVCADMLGYSTSLTIGYIRFTYSIENRRFTLIDMAHDRDHRWPCHLFTTLLLLLQTDNFQLLGHSLLNLKSKI